MATYLAPVPFRLKNKYLKLQLPKVREKVPIETDILPTLSKRFLNRFLGVDDFCVKKKGNFSLYLKRTSNKTVVMATAWQVSFCSPFDLD